MKNKNLYSILLSDFIRCLSASFSFLFINCLNEKGDPIISIYVTHETLLKVIGVFPQHDRCSYGRYMTLQRTHLKKRSERQIVCDVSFY